MYEWIKKEGGALPAFHFLRHINGYLIMPFSL